MDNINTIFSKYERKMDVERAIFYVDQYIESFKKENPFYVQSLETLMWFCGEQNSYIKTSTGAIDDNSEEIKEVISSGGYKKKIDIEEAVKRLNKYLTNAKVMKIDPDFGDAIETILYEYKHRTSMAIKNLDKYLELKNEYAELEKKSNMGVSATASEVENTTRLKIIEKLDNKLNQIRVCPDIIDTIVAIINDEELPDTDSCPSTCQKMSCMLHPENPTGYAQRTRTEKALREEIAKDIEEKMMYMGYCPNEMDTIIKIIKNDVHPIERHCATDCRFKDCKSHVDYKETNHSTKDVLKKIRTICSDHENTCDNGCILHKKNLCLAGRTPEGFDDDDISRFADIIDNYVSPKKKPTDEIIRCKDCCHFYPFNTPSTPSICGSCTGAFGLSNTVTENDFCSYATRKE